MAVFRVERNTGYTVMSNHHLRNKELSLKAKGLLSQMFCGSPRYGTTAFLFTQRQRGNKHGGICNDYRYASLLPLGNV